jgi:ParB family chromosome partitioning protein
MIKKIDSFMSKAAAISTDLDRPRERSSQARTVPGLMGDLQKQRDEALDRAEELEKKLEAAQSVGGPLEASLDELFEVPGRRRHKSTDEYDELKENISRHGLQHAISVRAREGGGYEILSGHHRWDVYKELNAIDPAKWGRVPIHIIQTEADQADEKAFYANLIQSSLSDFEKYEGLRRLQNRLGEKLSTLADIAAYTGVKEGTIKMLWQIGSLPEAALAKLAENPSVLGGNAAGKLARLAKEGKAAEVTAAITALVDDGIEQQEALRIASAVTKTEVKPVVKPVAIKSGRANYCSWRRVAKTVRVDFASETDAEEAAAAVEEVLKQLAEKKRAAG